MSAIDLENWICSVQTYWSFENISLSSILNLFNKTTIFKASFCEEDVLPYKEIFRMFIKINKDSVSCVPQFGK